MKVRAAPKFIWLVNDTFVECSATVSCDCAIGHLLRESFRLNLEGLAVSKSTGYLWPTNSKTGEDDFANSLLWR